MVLTEVEFPLDNLSMPYRINHSLPEARTNFKGYSIQQKKGFNFSLKKLELKYVKLTASQKNSFLTLFQIQDPFTIFKITLIGDKIYKLSKPSAYSLEEFKDFSSGTVVLKYNLTFSCRILE